MNRFAVVTCLLALLLPVVPGFAGGPSPQAYIMHQQVGSANPFEVGVMSHAGSDVYQRFMSGPLDPMTIEHYIRVHCVRKDNSSPGWVTNRYHSMIASEVDPGTGMYYEQCVLPGPIIPFAPPAEK